MSKIEFILTREEILALHVPCKVVSPPLGSGYNVFIKETLIKHGFDVSKSIEETFDSETKSVTFMQER